MMQRIDWTENSPTRIREGTKAEALADWLKAEDERGQLKDMSLNRCLLIFEGEEKARGFRKFGSKVCETDSAARDALTRAKMENFWALAKSMR
jgi:U4/U6 small nuclear ribonucleoprotein PRP3